MFKIHDIVQHKKGGLYMITEIPNHKKLEYCNASFYEYINLDTREVWLRCKEEFEDGRFMLTQAFTNNEESAWL